MGDGLGTGWDRDAGPLGIISSAIDGQAYKV